MKLKRVLAGITSALLMITAIPVTAFAEETASLAEQVPDVTANVLLFNTECLELPNLEDDLSMVISRKTDGSVIAEIPLTTVVDEDGEETTGYWQGIAMDALTDEVMDELIALQGELEMDDISTYNSVEEADDVLEDIEEEVSDILDGFNVTLSGAPEGHYEVETIASVMTSEIMEYVIELLKEVFAYEMQSENPDYVVPESFSQLIKDYLEYAEISLDELAEELGMEALLDDTTWAEVDEAVEFLCSDEFKGMLVVNAYLDCDCPETISYEVVHEYYKVVDGKKTLVGTASYGPLGSEYDDGYYYEGKTGDLIKAEDYINCEFGGKTYKYVGSYEYFDEYELSEFTLSGGWDDPYGLILRYELEEDADDNSGVNTGSDKNNQTTDTDNKSGNSDVKVNATNAKAAQTGDHSHLGRYIVLLVAAVAVVVVLVIKKRKK